MYQDLLWISFQRNLQIQVHMCLCKHGYHLPLHQNIKDNNPLLTNTTSTHGGLLRPNSCCTSLRYLKIILCACTVQLWCSSTSMFGILTFCWNPFLGTFTNLLEVTVNFVMSVCPHWTIPLPRDGSSWNLIFEHFSKTLSRKLKFH